MHHSALETEFDQPLSTLAFKFNLRYYTKEKARVKQFSNLTNKAAEQGSRQKGVELGTGLHSSTSQLNVSTILWYTFGSFSMYMGQNSSQPGHNTAH